MPGPFGFVTRESFNIYSVDAVEQAVLDLGIIFPKLLDQLFDLAADIEKNPGDYMKVVVRVGC